MIVRDQAHLATTVIPRSTSDVTERMLMTIIEAEIETVPPTVANDTAKTTTAGIHIARDLIVMTTGEIGRIANTDTGTRTETMAVRVTLDTIAIKTGSTAAIDHRKGARLQKSVAFAKPPSATKSSSSSKRASSTMRKVRLNELPLPSS